MPLNDLEYVVEMLKDCNLKKVANNVGLSYRTVRGIAKGTNQSPSFNTVRLLSEYFKAKARGDDHERK